MVVKGKPTKKKILTPFGAKQLKRVSFSEKGKRKATKTFTGTGSSSPDRDRDSD